MSRSSYYDYREGSVSQRARENQQLTGIIRQLHQESKQSYGSPRITKGLRQRSIRIFRPGVARLMRLAGLTVASEFIGSRFNKGKWSLTTV